MPETAPCPDADIARYTAYRISQTTPIDRIDGNLDKPAWCKAPKSPRFVDMVDGRPGFYDTRMASLWDDQFWYIGFWLEEPFVEAQHTQRDALIFQESDVEVFIDGGDCYYELEINALATLYEVMFIWRDAHTRGSRFDTPAFDVSKAFTFGGNYDREITSFWHGTHPRGTRWAFTDWDFPGLQVAVQVQGTLNNHSDIDKGWTVEIALPWSGMTPLANGRSLPPQSGDTWRAFFGRFQKLMNAGQEVQPHPAWVLSAHGTYDTHQTDCFPYVTFSGQTIDDGQP
jgi:hypothetical protein